MLDLRLIHKLQEKRKLVRLSDGRTGKIVRVDTFFPGNRTQVSVYVETEDGPGEFTYGLEELFVDESLSDAEEKTS